MNKILMALALIFAVGVVRAEENRSWKSWYSDMLRGLKSRMQKKLESRTRVSAVAAVRGSKEGEDPNALYWKGGVSEKAQKKLAEEKKQFADAVELVVGGDVEGGRAALNKFLKDNPDSFFCQDAKDALEKLPAPEAAPKEVKKGAAADETKAEDKKAGQPAGETGN